MCFEFRVAKRETETKRGSLFLFGAYYRGDHTSSLYAEKVLLRRVRFLVVGLFFFFFSTKTHILFFLCAPINITAFSCVLSSSSSRFSACLGGDVRNALTSLFHAT